MGKNLADNDKWSKFSAGMYCVPLPLLQISRELRQVAWGSAVSLYLEVGVCKFAFLCLPLS